jgi:hypothetical protein
MRILIAAAAALVGLMAPAGALASGGGQSGGSQGVHTDPNSPAARQYVLPVQAARSEAGGGGQASGQGSNVPHPFGAGISAPSSHTSTKSRSSASAAKRQHKSHTPRAGATPRLPVPATGSPGGYAAPVSGKESASTNGGSGWLPLIGGGLLVLLLGGGGGLALRRRLSTSST